mmetsp:Transcript_30540/g.65790  ORF Transcript_30540/g.65790 Transcript_30540/m.65790 type:complete len:450 (-) Transcript_30540:617-1966(-)|eukprot:CAMPEP_0206464558 /NCGR_PEP_ID=MMETSP0324_2-20121206/27290_1 /ASSEMBLY_ACC=CAM_ASM_000836 /TAXON_ID=2866 /ORGANISM="Crypthecodinium cohnii, Strain Seligo" /LENGTH=449 /DNA_ID=CAMNT_0053937217 /DNA_START=62 /DNA_END=1411 /DNA_ORIENTATION=+
MSTQEEGGPAVALSDPLSVGLCPERLQRLDPFLEEIVASGKRPNAMVLVSRRGKTVYCKSTGLQNDGSKGSLRESKAPIREDSIFRIYSMTKPITSLALMMLYEEGRFQLNDPLWLYLGKAWKKENMRVWKSGSPKDDNVVTVPCESSITVLQVLTHTSGLCYGFDMEGLINPVDLMYANAKIDVSRCASLQEFGNTLAKQPLLFQPNTAWFYGFNTDIVGLLVETISGMKLSDFMEQRIFGPLKMVDTAFWVPVEKRHRFCDNYFELMQKGQSRMWNISRKSSNKHFTGDGVPACCSGGGGLVSTVHDYARFLQMVLNGGELDGARILSVKTMEWIAMNHLPGNKDIASMPAPLPGAYMETQPEGEGFGLGYSVKINNTAGQQIGSDGILMWGGAANTVFWIDPKEELFCVWMTQLMGYNEKDLPVRVRLRNIVYGSIVDRKLFQSKL